MTQQEQDLLCRVSPKSNPFYHDLFSQTSEEEIVLQRLEVWGYTEKKNNRWTSTPLGDRKVLDWMADD